MLIYNCLKGKDNKITIIKECIKMIIAFKDKAGKFKTEKAIRIVPCVYNMAVTFEEDGDEEMIPFGKIYCIYDE